MRRFIAGAVCPQCRAMDRLVVETVDGRGADKRRRCVACGYQDALQDAQPRVPATRLDAVRSGDAPVEPVRLVTGAEKGLQDSTEST